MAEEQMHDTDVEAKKAKNYVIFILDRSSSMRSFGAEAVDAVNQEVETIKTSLKDKENIEAEVCLLTFSSMVDTPELWCRPLEEISPWRQEDYHPSGMTALYDAMGFAIQEIRKQPDIDDPTTSVLMIVVTDGEENSSRVFDGGRLSRLIDEVQATGRWTITYEGANVDLEEVRGRTNILAGNMLNFSHTSDGFAVASAARSAGTAAYYSTVNTGVERYRVSGHAGDLSVNSFYEGSRTDQVSNDTVDESSTGDVTQD